MMARLVPCPSCGSLARHGDTKCPSCDAPIGDRTVVVRAAGTMLVLGLALAGCPASDDSGETMASEGSATNPTMTTTGETGSSSATEGDEVSTAPTTGPLYGTFATGTEDGTASTTGDESGSSSDSGSDGGTDTDTDTDGTTGPSPLYGVAET
jgi:hypothetical protein